MPLLLQALRALLAWLVGAEAAAKLGGGGGGSKGGRDVPTWRVKCGEALSRAMEEVAALKVR